ncbi:MAG: DUF3466 family protein [bacterium]
MSVSSRSFLAGVVIAANIVLISLVHYPASILAREYQVSSIEPLSGYAISRNLGINNLGVVVGRFYNYNQDEEKAQDQQAFIWDDTQGSRSLSTLGGESSAWDINDLGEVSGYSYTPEGHRHAVLWLDDGSIVDIGTLTNTTTLLRGESSTAYEINNLSQVVGNADIPNDDGTFTPYHGFLYDASGGIRDLGTLTTGHPQWQNGYSIAYDINNNSIAVGTAHDGSWRFLPFIYDETTLMRTLYIDANHPDGEWYAVAINDEGRIGGHVNTLANRSFPYVWNTVSSNPTRLAMPSGFPYGEIYGINESGQMVGIMWASDEEGAIEHAFVFDDEHGMRDLNDLIDPNAGWVLVFARDINDYGRIAGYGTLHGNNRGFILDPLFLIDGDNDGYSLTEGDCDDNDPNIFPGAIERCDDLDNDCDGLVDEEGAAGCIFYYMDADGDGYGITGDMRCLCKPEGYHTAVREGDPDDSDPNVAIGSELFLTSGWHMISLPVIPPDRRRSALFPDAGALFKLTTGYEPLGPDDELNIGKGYWIYMGSTTSYMLQGKPIEGYTVPAFHNGWFMIGGCSRPAKPSVGNGIIKAVFGFSNRYILLDRNAPLQPGRGYWIYCSGSTTLSVETGDE